MAVAPPDVLALLGPAALALAGPAPAWHPLGSPRADNGVWRLGDPGVVIKRLRNARPFVQERRAYAAWAPHLSERTPALLAVDEPTRTLVLTRTVGVHPLGLAPADECAAHWRAGRFLRALHAVPDPGDDAMPLAEALVRRHAAALTRVAPRLTADERALLHAGALEIPALFADAARVPCHRDFGPHNWLIDGPRLTVLDFEHARPDCPLVDLIKLAVDWPARPDLEAALLDGYGRDLDPRERARLRVHLALHAMTTLAWAHAHRDPVLLAAGRRALAVALPT
jgi:Ser/Thr protein kinase RdoA (MazF antagonist)